MYYTFSKYLYSCLISFFHLKGIKNDQREFPDFNQVPGFLVGCRDWGTFCSQHWGPRKDPWAVYSVSLLLDLGGESTCITLWNLHAFRRESIDVITLWSWFFNSRIWKINDLSVIDVFSTWILCHNPRWVDRMQISPIQWAACKVKIHSSDQNDGKKFNMWTGFCCPSSTACVIETQRIMC